jgi:POT family proton-dependent oligopeptide transporter
MRRTWRRHPAGCRGGRLALAGRSRRDGSATKSTGATLTFSERLQEIRTGFERPFWVANISELFERLSYYAVFAVLARYLHEGLHFDVERASSLTGMFGGWVWFLAVIGGALADRLGFRRALSLAYLILTFAYFMLGSIGSAWLAPLARPRAAGRLGGIRPDPARAGRRSGEAFGGRNDRARVQGKCPLSGLFHLLHAGQRRQHGGTIARLVGARARHRGECISHRGPERVSHVLCRAAASSRSRAMPTKAKKASLRQVGKNFLTVLSNPRFMLFLLIFTGYWVVFWQEFIALPLYISYLHRSQGRHGANSCDRSDRGHLFHHGDRLSHQAHARLSRHRAGHSDHEPGVDSSDRASLRLDGGGHAGGGCDRRDRATTALLRLHLASRARLGQQGTYMGFAFLPLGIGSFIAGPFSGWLMHHFGEEMHRPSWSGGRWSRWASPPRSCCGSTTGT